MPTVYIVDVPEFRPVVEFARKRPQCRIGGAEKGYFKIEIEGEITFNRREMQMKPAIWYGLFTGGLDGEVKSWGRDEVTVIGTNKPL